MVGYPINITVYNSLWNYGWLSYKYNLYNSLWNYVRDLPVLGFSTSIPLIMGKDIHYLKIPCLEKLRNKDNRIVSLFIMYVRSFTIAANIAYCVSLHFSLFLD